VIERVRIYEVGPRDGLQNEKTIVPVDVKAEYIARLVAAGLTAVDSLLRGSGPDHRPGATLIEPCGGGSQRLW